MDIGTMSPPNSVNGATPIPLMGENAGTSTTELVKAAVALAAAATKAHNNGVNSPNSNNIVSNSNGVNGSNNMAPISPTSEKSGMWSDSDSYSTDTALSTGTINIPSSASDKSTSPTSDTATALPPTKEEAEAQAPVKKKRTNLAARIVKSGDFEAERHFYPRVLNANIHPLVSSFFSLGNERIMSRYTHLNPQVNEQVLKECLSYKPKYFQWAGSDLFNVTTASGQRQMIIVETNSCPSGQKSMPLLSEIGDEHGGYGMVIDQTFLEVIQKTDKTVGDLAVICDKNMMEASGYAAVMAESTKEKVWLSEYYVDDPDPPVKWVDGLMSIRDENREWHPIRACFRYVTQKPWNRFPINSKTVVLNSIVSCLAGGRNKMMAARAYDFFNAELVGSGLSVRIPETIRNVTMSEIPLWLDSMGGHAVIKVPYSNAGQGVYTITNAEELRAFMSQDHYYDKFIVQSLVGNASWSSVTRAGKFYHVGTIPNKKQNTFVSDLRMMVTANEGGFRPVACYARRARKPLAKRLEDEPNVTSWEMLGTNLSVKKDDEWTTEAQRLLLMDRKDFNQLGIGIDDLIDAYIQTVLSVIAIDKMCKRLMKDNERMQTPAMMGFTSANAGAAEPKRGEGEAEKEKEEDDGSRYPWATEKVFDFELFAALNPDKALLSEIIH